MSSTSTLVNPRLIEVTTSVHKILPCIATIAQKLTYPFQDYNCIYGSSSILVQLAQQQPGSASPAAGSGSASSAAA